MTTTRLSPLDMTKLEIRQFLFHLLSSSPGSPVEGQPYWDTTQHYFAVYNGTSFLVGGCTLDQMAAAGDVAFGAHKLTGVANGVSGTDAINLGQLQAAIAGVQWKAPVRAATTANGTLASAFANGSVIDGVTLATGDRILLKNQTSVGENGIRVVAASGAPARATDADSAAELLNAAVWVEEGTTNADSGWVATANAPITVDTTDPAFVQFNGISSLIAGTGLTKSGSTVNAVAGATPGSGGPGGGLVANADDLVIDKDVVARKFSVDVGDGASTAIDVVHNLGTLDVLCQVYVKGTGGAMVEVDVKHKDTNTVTLTFAVAPTAAQYRATVLG